MKNLIFTLIVICAFSACKSEKEVQSRNPINHIVIFDLSDRLLYTNQAEKDKAIFREILDGFVSYVNNNIVLTSRDKFQVRIIPQKGSKVDQDHFEQVLSIDLSALPIQDKKEALEAFKSGALQHLDQLYQLAYLGNKSFNYAGVDIWKYFNEQLKGDLMSNYENRLFLLTDGYFDFENNDHSIESNNQYTHSHFLSSPLFAQVDWKQKAEEENYGYLPIQLEKSFQLFVIGIQPKKDQLLETEKLEYFWSKWMSDSGAETPFFIRNASPVKMSGELRDMINKSMQ